MCSSMPIWRWIFFFLLSGFVIAHAYQQRLENGMSLQRFMVARAIRLYPLIILGALLGIGYALGSAWLNDDAQAARAIMLMAPLAMLALPVLPQLSSEPFPLNRPTWSLFNELLVNLLYALLAPRLSTRALLALVVISFCVEAATIVHYGSLQVIGSNFASLAAGIPRTVFPFFFGVLLYRWHLWLHAKSTPRMHLGFGGLALLLLMSFAPLPLRWGEIIYQLLCIGLLYPAIIMLGSNPLREQRLEARMRSAVTILGELSFPIYVLHYPLFDVFAKFATHAGFVEGQPRPWYLLAISLIVVLLSYLTLRSYDMPLRAWLSRRYRMRKQCY